MSSETVYIHRECIKCGHNQRTRAKKAWRCKHCGTLNHIRHSPKLKPYHSPRLISKGLDQFNGSKEPR